MRMRYALAAAACAIVMAAVPADAAAAIDWGECPIDDPRFPPDPRQQCAQLTVPLDYKQPSGQQIEIAVSRIVTSSPSLRRGVILFNPGGPGSPGLDMPSDMAQTMPQSVLDRYDLIGFDPRGINHSAPVGCSMTDDQLDVTKFLPYPAPDGSIDGNIAYSQAIANQCDATDRTKMRHNTTANTARDMDRIRAALGEEKISYFGYSYGTYLGGVYSSLFPNRTDRFILDSVVSPYKIWRETWHSWTYSTEIRFADFTEFMAAHDAEYGFGDTEEEVYDAYLALAAHVDANPIDLGGGTFFRGNDFRSETRRILYLNDLLFPALADFWVTVRTLSGGSVSGAAAALAFPTPPRDNGFASIWAVICDDADWPVTPEQHRRDVARDSRLFPIAGGMAANIWPCSLWKQEPAEPPVKMRNSGGGQILLVQGLRDPATPYDGGVAMRVALGNRSRLATINAGGHSMAYTGKNTCADEVATRLFVEGVMSDGYCAPAPPAAGAARGSSDREQAILRLAAKAFPL